MNKFLKKRVNTLFDERAEEFDDLLEDLIIDLDLDEDDEDVIGANNLLVALIKKRIGGLKIISG